MDADRAERRRQRLDDGYGIPYNDPDTDAIEREFQASAPEGASVPPGATTPDLSTSGIPAATGSSYGNDPRGQIGSAYEKYLGRRGSDEEIASQMGKGYNLSQSLSNIQSSQEALNYARKQRELRDNPTPTSTPQTTTPGASPTTAPGGDNSGGAAAGYDYIPGTENIQWGDTSRLSGFNTNEWGAGGTEGYDEYSYKNIFGKIASRYAPSPEGARQLFNDPDFKRAFPRAVLVDHPTDPKIKLEPGETFEPIVHYHYFSRN